IFQRMVIDATRMSLGVLVTEDDPSTGGPERIFNNLVKRFKDISGDVIQLKPYYVCKNSFPETVGKHPGYIITGAHYNVNEGLEWMNKLENFIRQIKEKGDIKLFGICFGHQMTARAFGGKVGLNPSKRFIWGCDRVEVSPEFAEMCFYKNASLNPTYFHIMQSHYDQVIETPESARVLGGCEECPDEILMYGENILTMQGHPELIQERMLARLLTRVENKNLTKEEADKARATLQLDEGDKLMKLIVAFFQQ
uniref:Glutamine amidotransferase domain-containing protein n=2 Tax=Clytia hemisphaerica TaxID=252671 RepID=A0A7M5VCS9_9CNID